MKKIACQYSIVRFMPFVETGEFANVGIVMMSSHERYFGFKLMTRKYGRVSKFFEEIESNVLRQSMVDLRNELERVENLLKSHGFDKRYKSNDEQFASGLFSEILRTRETIVRFSAPSVVLTEEPKGELKNLYSRYIERHFVTKEYRERVLEGRIKELLARKHIIDRYVQDKIGNDLYHVTFPFVEKIDGKPVRIIKPLNIAEGEPSRIIERGGQWGFRVHELRRRDLLPNNVLFAVDDPPLLSNINNNEAYSEALDLLRKTGVDVLELGKEQKILEFAAGA